jgi:hypothetical protein
LGVFMRCCERHCCRPATAEPCVPSTWNVARSSRRTRTHQLMLSVAMIPPSSSSMAYAASSAFASYGLPDSSQRFGMCVAPMHETLFTLAMMLSST